MAAKQSHDEPDIRICVGFFRHHKTQRLRRALGWDGVIALVMLWCWARTNRHKGSLAGMTDEDVEIAAEWTGAPGSLVSSLVASGWLDGESGEHRLHDWKEHQAYAFNADKRKAVARMGASARHGKTYKRCSKHAGSKQVASNQHAGGMLSASTLPAPSPAHLSRRRSAGDPAPLGGAVAAPDGTADSPPVDSTTVDPDRHLYAPLFVPLPKRALPR